MEYMILFDRKLIKLYRFLVNFFLETIKSFILKQTFDFDCSMDWDILNIWETVPIEIVPCFTRHVWMG